MPIDHRDEKTVATVACPYCLRPVGAWCVSRPGASNEIVSVHTERRAAWQIARGPVPPTRAKVLCVCGHSPTAHGSERAEEYGCENCDCAASREDVRRGAT